MSQATIHAVRGNHAEELVGELSARLKSPLPDPFAKELIVVQGRGMALWLNMELARRAGVWAHAEYLYPKHFVARAFELVLGRDENTDDRFTRDQMLWAIAAALPAHLKDPAFEQLRAYIGADVGSARLFQLAARIAEAFDEYLTFRADLLIAWERPDKNFSEPQLSLFGQPESADPAVWQRKLWRSVVQLLGRTHSATRAHRFFQALNQRKKRAALPARISVFGLSSMPPLYTRVLAALSAHVEVTIFQLSPCSQYFGDILGRARQANPFDVAENRLLKSYGTLGAEFAEVLDEQCQALAVEQLETTLYEPNSDATALGRLQNGILEFIEEKVALPFDPSSLDDSIRIHSCHSPIREVEVLHDQLLEVFSHSRAEAHEVIVMTPDIDAYAPLIQAVFERPSTDPRRIPYRISDRNLKGDSPVLDALYRILSLVNERLTASQVLDLLSLTPIHTQFEIAAPELETVARWVVESGIRWGVDADHKASFGVPRSEQNTWTFGLDRLLLGYATQRNDFQLLDGTLTSDEVEGKLGLLLGRFSRFSETLFELLERLKQPQSIQAWRLAVIDTLTRLVHSDGQSQWQHQQILSAIADMERAASLCHYAEPIELAVFKKFLERHFDADRGARGFLSGGVTFCAMVPMRSIPFRIVYLLGMNDTSFPRSSQRPDFNLLEAHPESRLRGDPNRRADDRYLFLEAVLSARSQLVLSYVGQSIRDNTPRAPSVVVTELLDYLVRQYAFTLDEEERVRSHVVALHPLQPFSPRYYDGNEPRLFSYEQAYLEGARRVGGQRTPVDSLFDKLLPAIERPEELTDSELIRFFKAPAAYLLRARLGVYLDGRPLQIREREPLELDPLEGYQVGHAVLAHRLAGLDADRSYALAQQSGLLPFGAPGLFEFTKAQDSVEPILEAFQQLTEARTAITAELRLKLPTGQSISGDSRNLYPQGLVHCQFSRTKSKALLAAWIQHLILCGASPKVDQLGIAPVTWLLGRRKGGRGATVTRFATVNDPVPLLLELVQLLEAGLRWPVPFFPESSFDFVRALAKSDVTRALSNGNTAWRAEVNQSATLQRIYGTHFNLGSIPVPQTPEEEDDSMWRFEVVAPRVYGPMLEHMEDVS